MRRDIEALLVMLEGAIGEEGLNDIAGAILDRLEKDRAAPLQLAPDPAITLLKRDRSQPKSLRAPSRSPGERVRKRMHKRGCFTVPLA